MSSHTPGPWKAVRLTNNFGEVETYVVSETKQVARVFGTNDCDAMENARLIAAEPELLEVAQGILSDDMFSTCPPNT